MLNRYGPSRVVLMNSDTFRNEQPLTVERIAWCLYFCPCRSGADTVQLAFDSAALTQVLRMAGCGERCEAMKRAAHPQSTFAAGIVASDRIWLRCCLIASASLYMDALQTRISIERHFSRLFPAFPRSLASVLIPRPITPRHNGHAAGTPILRHSPFCFGYAAIRVWVSKQKPPAQQARGCGPKYGRDFSSEPPQKARLRPWERGTLPPQHAQNLCRGPRDLASLRARVSRG